VAWRWAGSEGVLRWHYHRVVWQAWRDLLHILVAIVEHVAVQSLPPFYPFSHFPLFLDISVDERSNGVSGSSRRLLLL
jgi:hypothetical protein